MVAHYGDVWHYVKVMRWLVRAFNWVSAVLWLIYAGLVSFSDFEPERWLIAAGFLVAGMGLIWNLLEDERP